MRLIQLLIPSTLAVLLAGCGGGATVPQDHFYRLATLQVEQRFETPPIDGLLRIERINAFGIYRERAVLYSREESIEAIQQHNYHHWVDAPTALVQDQLHAYLQDTGIATRVADERSDGQAKLSLQLELKSFERVLRKGGKISIQVAINAQAIATDSRKRRLERRYRSDITAEDATMSASVRAMNKGLQEIYAKLVGDLGLGSK